MDLVLETTAPTEILDITTEIKKLLPKTIEHGTCTVFVPHTTAGVTVNENESGLLHDINTLLEEIVPHTESYEHNAIDNNAAAHLRSLLIGQNITIPIESNELGLGPWQSILFIETDGPQTRQATVTFGGI